VVNLKEKTEYKKGYKKTKLGWIPEEWEVVKLGDCAYKIGSGITPKGGRSTYKQKGVPFIRSQNVLYGTLSLNDVAFIDEKQHKSMSNSVAKPNDILINITGASIGRACILPLNIIEANVNQHVCIIRIGSALKPSFLLNFLLSSKGQDQIDKFQAGGNREGLNFEQLRSFYIPIAPLSEQQKIAEALATWDEGVEALEKLIDKKQILKKALTQKLLTGKLRCKHYRDSNWKHKHFNQIFERITRKNTENNKNILTISAQKGLVSQEEFYNKRIASVDTSKYMLLENGEFAYNKSYSKGYPMGAIKRLDFYKKGVVSSLYLCFKLNNQNCCSDFFAHYFEAGLLNNEIQMIAQEGARNHGLLNITPDDFFNTLLFIPILKEEQQKIAAILNSCDEEIKLLNYKLGKLKEQKKGLMQKLLTGQIRVKI